MKMKTITTKWAMLIALVTAVSCSETETGIEPELGGGDGQVALGINPEPEGGSRNEIDNEIGGERQCDYLYGL